MALSFNFTLVWFHFVCSGRAPPHRTVLPACWSHHCVDLGTVRVGSSLAEQHVWILTLYFLLWYWFLVSGSRPHAFVSLVICVFINISCVFFFLKHMMCGHCFVVWFRVLWFVLEPQHLFVFCVSCAFLSWVLASHFISLLIILLLFAFLHYAPFSSSPI